ncbi:hypothetical protein ACFU6I_46725 [Streptomyces sp. NPDC057486]|uniref:hypothetical protein n=1 Tax=Streptomyces sp. NPDC057486 TaxID=3346145 RepID=UPI0036C91FC9
MGTQAKALLVRLNAVDELAKTVERTFRTHPDAPVMLSFPGIGPGVGARLLKPSRVGARRVQMLVREPVAA